MKAILVFLSLTLSLSAMASPGGRLEIQGGQTIVRINVGDEKDTDTRQMMKRIAMLERAVRELQNRVYDLEDDQRPQGRMVTQYICSMDVFNEQYVGEKKDSEMEARASAREVCKKNRNGDGFFCKDDKIKKCDTVQVWM